MLLRYNMAAKIRKKIGTMKKIIVSPEVNKKIQEIFGVTQPNVSQALNYRRHSQNAKRMRMYALSHGGVMLESKDEHTNND